jgi:hypothetical protein
MLIEPWASMKSFRRKDGNDEPPAPGRNGKRNLPKEKRSNETHASTTDPDTRHGEGAKLPFCGTLPAENRNGVVVDACLTDATGTAEPEVLGHKTVGVTKVRHGGLRDHERHAPQHDSASTHGSLRSIVNRIESKACRGQQPHGVGEWHKLIGPKYWLVDRLL